MLSLWTLSSVVLGMIFFRMSSAAGLLATEENGNLARADAVLETIFGADARVLSIEEGDFRQALRACVAGNQGTYKSILFCIGFAAQLRPQHNHIKLQIVQGSLVVTDLL